VAVQTEYWSVRRSAWGGCWCHSSSCPDERPAHG